MCVEWIFLELCRLMPSGNYRTIRGNREVVLHPTSALVRLSKLPNWIIFHDVIYTTREYARDVSAINPHWIGAIAPHFYKIRETEDYLGGGNNKNSTSYVTTKKRKRHDVDILLE